MNKFTIAPYIIIYIIQIFVIMVIVIDDKDAEVKYIKSKQEFLIYLIPFSFVPIFITIMLKKFIKDFKEAWKNLK